MTQKILLVEDDPCFGSVLQSYLQLSDYEVTLRVNGNEGLNAFRREKFDICLLDVMMPEMDGFTLGKKIREIDPSVPFVYITAKSLKEDMKLGYEIGADDYIVKPFRYEVFLARIKSLTRKVRKFRENNIVIGKLKIMLSQHKVYLNDVEVNLSRKEYEILNYLITNSNILLTRTQIIDRIWGYDFDGDIRTVDTHIKTLRAKLGAIGKSIKTIRGCGYRFDVDDGKNG